MAYLNHLSKIKSLTISLKKTQNTYTCTCIVIFYYIESRNHNITNTKITLNKKNIDEYNIFFVVQSVQNKLGIKNLQIKH